MVVLLRSFVLICQELGISNIEYCDLILEKIDNITIEQWSDYNVENFKARQSLLSDEQKRILSIYLKKCEEMLKL